MSAIGLRSSSAADSRTVHNQVGVDSGLGVLQGLVEIKLFPPGFGQEHSGGVRVHQVGPDHFAGLEIAVRHDIGIPTAAIAAGNGVEDGGWSTMVTWPVIRMST
ncbi:hypothetical protein AB0K60_10080 [Thermopolyspora sp. NPDC052614]|uniref:hypothetical protein n=1 Tax=Thermopolyspora sp. NPDC052614 TaxID=3155682 RepID=UPI00342FCCBB